MDLLLLFFSNSVHLISEMLFALRSLHVSSLLDTGMAIPSEAIGSRSTEALCQTTYTSFGFFCSSLEALNDVPARLKRTGGCVVFPTVLCGLRPGIEANPAQLRDTLLPGSTGGRLEVISGMFDVRLTYDSAMRERQPTEADVFRWVIDIYRRLFTDDGTVRTVHTLWGYDATVPPASTLNTTLPRRSLPPGAQEDGGPARFIQVPAVEIDQHQEEALQAVLGGRWDVFSDVVDYYNSLVSSPIFARYLADVGQFIGALRDELVRARGTGENVSPRDIEVLLRRVTMIIVSRSAGATPGGEKEVVLGRAVGQQKVLMALSALSEIIVKALGSAQAHTRLIGLTAIGEPRTTRLYWSNEEKRRKIGKPLIIFELPAVGDVWRVLIPLVHEVAHTYELGAQEQHSLWEMLAAEFTSEVFRAIFGTPPKTRVSFQDVLDVIRAKLDLTTSPASENFRSNLRQSLRPQGMHALLTELSSGRLSSLASTPLLVSFQASDVGTLSERFSRHLRKVQQLNNECRADVIAAEICGSARYQQFLKGLALSTPSRGSAMVDMRHRALDEVQRRLNISAEADRGNVDPFGNPYDALIDWLTALARDIRARIHSNTHPLREVAQLIEQLESSNGGLDISAADTLLDLWGKGLERHCVTARNRRT